MPDLIRHPPSLDLRRCKGRWTPDQVRGDGWGVVARVRLCATPGI